MRNYLTAFAVVLLVVTTGGAQAAQTRPLTVRQATTAIKNNAKDGLGALLYTSIGAAPVHVSRCRTHGLRGRCAVVVYGSTQTCRYTGHALKLSQANSMVWGTGLRCDG